LVSRILGKDFASGILPIDMVTMLGIAKLQLHLDCPRLSPGSTLHLHFPPILLDYVLTGTSYKIVARTAISYCKQIGLQCNIVLTPILHDERLSIRQV
jgi:hypothetical protein